MGVLSSPSLSAHHPRIPNDYVGSEGDTGLWINKDADRADRVKGKAHVIPTGVWPLS